MRACYYFLRRAIVIVLLLVAVTAHPQKQSTVKKENTKERLRLAAEMDKSIRTELLNKWYPRSVDSLYGGFLSTFTYDFQPTGPQDKMIVSQSRHVWSSAIAAGLYPTTTYDRACARQCFT